MSDPVRYSKAVHRAAFDAGNRLLARKDEPADAGQHGQRAASWLIRIIDAVEDGIRQTSSAPAPQTEDSAIAVLYRCIDTIVTRLWLAKQGLDAGEAGEVYERIKPILDRIGRFALAPDLGIIAPFTAHHAMECLNEFVKVDPSGVLKIAWQLASRSPGYSLDSLAIEQVVKLVEVILADHRQQMREPESLRHLLDLLEIFAETGWPQALRLVWRLDEVFR